MTAPARFGRLASMYRWLEYLSFGPYLDRCRNLRLPEMTSARNALVYGDGDGRFLARLVSAAPQMTITAVDADSTMLRHAARRLPPQAHVTLRQADALAYTPQGHYDLIVSHFFVDCFSDAELISLLQRLPGAIDTSTVWVLSDFALPSGRVSSRVGRMVISALYTAFGMLTGLRTRSLPDHAAVMNAAGWLLEDQEHLLAGLLVSERWRYTGPAASGVQSQSD